MQNFQSAGTCARLKADKHAEGTQQTLSKAGTGCDEPRVLDATDESVNTTSEMNDGLYFGSNEIKPSK